MQIKYLLTSHTKLPCPRQGLLGGFSTNDYESEMVVIIYKKNSPSVFNGWNDEVRARNKQSLL